MSDMTESELWERAEELARGMAYIVRRYPTGYGREKIFYWECGPYKHEIRGFQASHIAALQAMVEAMEGMKQTN